MAAPLVDAVVLTDQFVNAARGLIRTGLSPRTAYLGWYHLEETLGVTPIGRDCLAMLGELACLPPVPDASTLPRMLATGLRLAELAAPDAAAAMQPGIDAFLSFIDQR